MIILYEIGFFGQKWPFKFYLVQQTISGELVIYLLGTLIISYIIDTVKVKNLLIYYNPQVTNAYNSLVGTSEAICLLNKNKRFIHKISNNNNDNLKIKQ
jgi:biotin transporter BioY